MARTLYSKMARNPIIFVTSLFRTLCAIKLIKTSVHADDLKLPLSSQGEFSLCAMKDLKLRNFWGRAAKQPRLDLVVLGRTFSVLGLVSMYSEKERNV